MSFSYSKHIIILLKQYRIKYSYVSLLQFFRFASLYRGLLQWDTAFKRNLNCKFVLELLEGQTDRESYDVNYRKHDLQFLEFGSRIIGGDVVPMGYAGYHASLQNLTGHHVCGGAIIAKDFIVTAAHCLVGAEPEYVKVVIGTSHLDHGGIEYEVKSIEIHEGHNPETKVNDIALVQVKTTLDLNGMIKIIDLYDDELMEHDDIVLTGFGALEPNGESSRQMHILYLQVFSQETCKFAMRNTRKVYDTMFCTFTRIGEGTCHGDSGGPLVINGKLAGLVSWGIPCAVGFPDVHTRIKPYNDWIRKSTII